MYKTDVAILTGAGASIPVEIPGMRQMAAEFKSDMEDSPYTDTHEMLSDLAGTDDVEEILELANSIEKFSDGATKKLIERCISPHRGSEPLRKFEDRLEQNVEEIREFEKVMYDWITEICWGFDREMAKMLYQDVVDNAHKRQIPIFTTNYDAVMDFVAEEQGIPVCDNFFEGDRDREYWDDTLGSFHNDGLRLIKIHGSVQWHVNPAGTIEKIDHKATHNWDGDPLERLLIFPTRFKDIYQRNYFPLYSAFTRTLGRCSVLIVIGHSLRDDYLRAAIRERLRRGELDLIYVGPDFDAESDLLQGVRSQRERQVVHLNRKVEEVYPLLTQLLARVPASEMASLVEQSQDALSRGRKEKIDVDELDVYVREGELQKFVLEVDTIVGGGRIRAHATITSELPIRSKIGLDLDPIGDGGWPAMDGFNDYRIPVTIKVPEYGANEYELEFVLEDLNGDVADVKKRKFLIKKDG